jgi:hypothetical protein
MAAPAKSRGPKATGTAAAEEPTAEEGRERVSDSDAIDRSDELEVNRSLDEVMDLMAHETERLKVVLEYYRLVDAPNKQERIRHLVREIDRRQDRLEELKQLILAASEDPEH